MSRRRSGPRIMRPGRAPARRVADSPVEQCLRIDAQSDEGRGLARQADGKRVFVRGALPGEEVLARIERRHRQYDEAGLLQVLSAAPQRVEPPCPVYGECGGCTLQHQRIDAQRAHKQAVLEQLLAPFEPLHWEAPLLGPEWGYRHRARLLLAGGHCGFRAAASHRLVAAQDCLVLQPALREALPQLRAALGSVAAAGRWRGEVHLACGDGAVCGALLDLEAGAQVPDVETCLEALAARGLLAAARVAGRWLRRFPGSGSGAASDTGSGIDPGVLCYPGTALEFCPGDFTQANPAVNAQLRERVLAWLAVEPGQPVADYFCGLGNFSLPLAAAGARVTGYDLGEAMLQRGRDSARRQGLPLTLVAADLFAPGELADGFELAVLDPPRAGAEALCRLLAGRSALRRLVYVSCNPHTLARDAQWLARGGLHPVRAALADLFPHTAHLEAVVLFERK